MFFFNFDFLINTLNFLSFKFTVITIHAGACVFVFCFCLFLEFYGNKGENLIYTRKVELAKF